jgi:hypothetical protein
MKVRPKTHQRALILYAQSANMNFVQNENSHNKFMNNT